MSDLIRREDVLANSYNSLLYDARKQRYTLEVVEAYDIEDIPPVDAVEVVRCGECVHRHTRRQCDGRRKDWFCADGKRRAKDENANRNC